MYMSYMKSKRLWGNKDCPTSKRMKNDHSLSAVIACTLWLAPVHALKISQLWARSSLIAVWTEINAALIMPVGPTTDPPQVQVEWGSTAQWATAPHCNEVSSSFETPLQTCQNLVGLSGKSAKMQSGLTTCHLLVRCRLQISGRSEV